MKRTLLVIGLLILIGVTSFFSYVTGHRNGVVRANTQSMFYELITLEEFNKNGGDSAKTMLGHLINYREDSINEEIRQFEDWNYWRQIQWQKIQEENAKRMDSLSDQIPPRKTLEQVQSEVEKLLSEPK